MSERIGNTAYDVSFHYSRQSREDLAKRDFSRVLYHWDYSTNIEEYYDWENGVNPDFLYQPLVDVVDSCKEIDFCNPSDEKWDFAKTLLSVLEKNIKGIPDEIF